MIIISSNEPDVIKHGLDWHEKLEIQLLETGDIMLIEKGKVMLIERKGASDLLNSLADGRLIEQSSRLVESCNHPLLLIHGSILCNKEGYVVADGRTTRWKWWSVQMALLSVQAGGVMLLQLQKTQDIPDAIKYLQGWLSKESHLHVNKRERIPFVLPHKGIEMLSALPGIGLSKARDCLDFYGSAGRAIVELTCTEDCFLPKGVAGGTVAKIRDELDLQDDERLVLVIGEEDATE